MKELKDGKNCSENAAQGSVLQPELDIQEKGEHSQGEEQQMRRLEGRTTSYAFRG